MADYLKNLTEEQAQVANEIVSKAKQMGIDPKLAVALAYRESRLNPNTKNGSSGEIGLMQVKPTTAEGMGFSVDDLKDPSKNIEIGLSYLKQGLEKFGDPMLAVAGYNAGHNHPYFTDPENKSLPESTKDYLKEIVQNGGFEPSPAPQDEPAPPEITPASEDDFNANKMRLAIDAAGAGAGAVAGKVSDVGRGVIGGARDIVRASRTLPGALSVMESMTRGAAPPSMPSAPTAPSAPTPQAGALRPVVGGPAGPVSGPVGGPAGPLTQMGGPGAYNYGKAFGLTDIEAGRATDMSKQPGGASDLIAKRTEGLQKIQQLGGGFVENPNYGGIMTPQQSAGGGPRASFVQGSGGLTQLPPTSPISAAPPVPPQPGPLSQAGAALKQGAGAVLRSPVVSGALGGLSVAESAMEADKRMQAKDPTGAAIAGTGVMGGAMQMFAPPQLKALGALISAASPLTLYLRDNLKNQQPMPEATPEELLAAQRPAFMYARP